MKKYSYWLDTVKNNYENSTEIPKKVDTLIIGFGYTGLNAAIEVAKNGRSVCVSDKGGFGDGGSPKNGGQISNLLKPSLGELSKKYGFQKAKDIRREGVNALEWLISFIKSETQLSNFLDQTCFIDLVWKLRNDDRFTVSVFFN